MKRYFVLSFITLFLSNLTFGFYGSFDLFSEPKYKKDGFCDRGTHLELNYKVPGARVATLHEFVEGVCEIAVMPNKRTYNVRTMTYNNGLSVHSGVRETEQGTFKVEVVDGRQSNYKSLLPAVIVVRENGPDLATVLYSNP